MRFPTFVFSQNGAVVGSRLQELCFFVVVFFICFCHVIVVLHVHPLWTVVSVLAVVFVEGKGSALFDCRRLTAVGCLCFFAPVIGSIFHSPVLFCGDVSTVGQSALVRLARWLVELRMRRVDCQN